MWWFDFLFSIVVVVRLNCKMIISHNCGCFSFCYRSIISFSVKLLILAKCLSYGLGLDIYNRLFKPVCFIKLLDTLAEKWSHFTLFSDDTNQVLKHKRFFLV